jgi:hypothetical protein
MTTMPALPTPPKAWLMPEELQEITGYKTKKRIKTWLDSNKITYLENAAGAPLVSRALLECRMAGVDLLLSSRQEQNQAPGINVSALMSLKKAA